MDMMRLLLWPPMAVGLNHCCSGFSKVSVCRSSVTWSDSFAVTCVVTNEGQWCPSHQWYLGPRVFQRQGCKLCVHCGPSPPEC